MSHAKWSEDAFLDGLRQQQDPLADRTVQKLIDDDTVSMANIVFQGMHADGSPLVEKAPAALRDFFAQTEQLPSWVDLTRVERGAEAMGDHAFTGAVVLLASSLPRGYAAPCLCEVLTVSDDLDRSPYRRLMGVVQLLVNLASSQAFTPGGLVPVTAQKLRLLHAGVRTVIPKYRPHYREKYGPPVNHEDMLATLMAFSYLVIIGLRRLGVAMSAEEEEDFYYLWRVFAQLMGIHPDGRPDDDSFVPASVEEAGLFYASYARRHFTEPEENPRGPVLAQHNLEMMEHLIPAPLRLLGFSQAPHIVMSKLMAPEEMARVGLAPTPDKGLMDKLVAAAIKVLGWEEKVMPKNVAELLAWVIFQDMIKKSRGGEVMFIIPDSLAALRSPGLV